MLKSLKYTKLNNVEKKISYGKGAEIGVGAVAAFGFVAIVTIVLYKLFNSKTGEISLPGGYKFKFTS